MKRSDDTDTLNDEDIAALFRSAAPGGEPSAATDEFVRALANPPVRTRRRYRWLGAAAVVVLAVSVVPVLYRTDTPTSGDRVGRTESLSAPVLPAPQAGSEPVERPKAVLRIERAAEKQADIASDKAEAFAIVPPRDSEGAAAGDADSTAWREDASRWLDTIRGFIDAGRLADARAEAELFRRRHAGDIRLLGRLEAVMTTPVNSDPSPR